MKSNTILSFKGHFTSSFLVAFLMVTILYGLFIIKGFIGEAGEIPQLILSVVRIIIILGVMIFIIISNVHINLSEVKKDKLNFALIKEPAVCRHYIFSDIMFIFLTLLFGFIILSMILFPDRISEDENTFFFGNSSSLFAYYIVLTELDFNLIPIKSLLGYHLSTDSGEFGKQVLVLMKGSKTFVSRNWFYLKVLQEKSFSTERISLIRYIKVNGHYKSFLAMNIIVLTFLIASLFFVIGTIDFYAGLIISIIWLILLMTSLSKKVNLESGQLIIDHGRVFFNKVQKNISNINISNNRTFLLSKYGEIYQIRADDELTWQFHEIHKQKDEITTKI
jgi:hypothetical protein